MQTILVVLQEPTELPQEYEAIEDNGLDQVTSTSASVASAVIALALEAK